AAAATPPAAADREAAGVAGGRARAGPRAEEPAHRDADGGGAHGAHAVARAAGTARAAAGGDRRADPHDAELLELRGAAAAAAAPARAAPAARGGVRAVSARRAG